MCESVCTGFLLNPRQRDGAPPRRTLQDGLVDAQGYICPKFRSVTAQMIFFWTASVQLTDDEGSFLFEEAKVDSTTNCATAPPPLRLEEFGRGPANGGESAITAVANNKRKLSFD